jgi:type II secretory pathway component GspD/PulD (secretin)
MRRTIVVLALATVGCASATTHRSVDEVVSPVLAASRARTDSLIAVGSGGAPRRGAAAPAATPTTDSSFREIPLRYLDTLAAGALLRDMYRDTSAAGLRFSVLGRRSMVILSGTPAQMRRAATILDRADQPPGHILIEATVIQFSREVLNQFALAVDQAAKGTVKDAAVQLGSLVNPAVVFTSLLGSNNSQSFRASITALESEQLATVIARPYLSARSGDSANITIGRDRYVVTAAPTGVGNVSSQQVTTGVLLHLLPLIMPDSQVKLDVRVEQSEFIPTEGNETVQVDRSAAATIMQVRSGQTIVIGGLSLKRDSRYNAGVPWFRRIPFLGGQQGKDVKNTDVAILVTPYIWQPGTALPTGVPTPP